MYCLLCDVILVLWLNRRREEGLNGVGRGENINLTLWKTWAIPDAARTPGMGSSPLWLGLQLIQSTFPRKQAAYSLAFHTNQPGCEASKHVTCTPKKHLWILALSSSFSSWGVIKYFWKKIFRTKITIAL